MSAAAIGAAGYLYLHRKRRRKPTTIEKRAGDVRAFARMLQERFGMSAARAWDLAEEQAQKHFHRVAA